MTIGNEDTDDYSDIFFVFLPCITKPTASNLAVFFFFCRYRFDISYGRSAICKFLRNKTYIHINQLTLTLILYQARKKKKNLLMMGTKEQSHLIWMTEILRKKKVRSQVG